MTAADLRVFVVIGEEPSRTCVGAESARAEATKLVRRGERGVRIANERGDEFRWWPELCAESACYAPAVDGERCAPRAARERRRPRKGRPALVEPAPSTTEARP